MARLHQDQAKLLDSLDHLGNNGWARNSQTDALMPNVLGYCEEAGLTVARVKEAMMPIGSADAPSTNLIRAIEDGHDRIRGYFDLTPGRWWSVEMARG